MAPTLDSLARASGRFLMVAMDQRESLRQMVTTATGRRAEDERLVHFKLTVASEVGRHASGFLIDRDFGFDRVAAEGLLPSDCGLIVAADRLTQPSDGPVEDTDLDEYVDLHQARNAGAVAAKLLVIWREDSDRDRLVEMSAKFVRRCADAGLLSVLEGVAKGGSDLIREAARELAAVGPSLYKAQVPLAGRGGLDRLTEECAALNAEIPVPWVVLSQGVERADFPTAVRAACQAGASGTLAGRAIWSDLVGADPDSLAELLRSRSVPRLQQLASIVDTYGRSWEQR
ncbi:sulfofructosephosphate aldolase [Allokutzneria albata]|uniref:Sulfofructosephosphate aldolase n=2 Tax=Allokutzneria albata TaxID=211114 RepID=A0A1G9U434_ALLAB|nr:sulfofructosephosphate aldolase [Allokutzneria albata]